MLARLKEWANTHQEEVATISTVLLALLVVGVGLAFGGCDAATTKVRVVGVVENDRVTSWSCAHKQYTIVEQVDAPHRRWRYCGLIGQPGDEFSL